MTEALAALLDHLWRLDVIDVVAEVDVRNQGALAVLRRFGFVWEDDEWRECNPGVHRFRVFRW